MFGPHPVSSEFESDAGKFQELVPFAERHKKIEAERGAHVLGNDVFDPRHNVCVFFGDNVCEYIPRARIFLSSHPPMEMQNVSSQTLCGDMQ